MYSISPTIVLTSTTELRKNLPKVEKTLSNPETETNQIIVTKNNKPAFVMINYEKFKEYQELEEEYQEWQLFLELQDRNKEIKNKHYTQKQVEKLLGI